MRVEELFKSVVRSERHESRWVSIVELTFGPAKQQTR
jgi:hypothetical protein